MSLEIYFDFPKENSKMQTWYVGEKFALNYPLDYVAAVQASGDELEHIKATFSNLPITKGNFCKWNNELAAFIAGNMRTTL